MNIVVKSSTNRLDIPSKFIYTTINNMYANDITDRVLGMLTFSDGSEGIVKKALDEAGIKLVEQFKFNNSKMFDFVPEDIMNEQFFDKALSNY